MEFVGSAMDELCITEEGSRRGRVGRRRVDYNDDTGVFKSKNLQAERRRRQKLSDRLLALRAIMTKASIIEDAVTYIQELQGNVKDLTDQLFTMEASLEEGAQTTKDKIDAAEEMKQSGIEEDVHVTDVGGNKLWIKIILEKKQGRFTKLLEYMSYLGFELTDANVTTSKGALFVSSCVEGTYGSTLTAQKTKDLLQDIITGI